MSAAPLPRWADVLVIPLINVAIAFVLAGVVVALVGVDPFEALSVMLQGAFVYPSALGYTLYYATNFVFTGLAVAVAFHARLFNIGGEGQAAMGGLGVIFVALALDPYLPGIVVLPLAILAAALFGAAWAFVPGVLQATRGSHVVITTIMFNFIAAGITVWLLGGPLMRAGQSTPQSRNIAPGATMPRIDEIAGWLGIRMDPSPLNLSIVFAGLAAVLVGVMVWRTPFGFRLRTMGESEPAARYAGVNVARMTVAAMSISGALAGLMAINSVLGDAEKLTLGNTGGFGFTGIAVALMGRGHPVGIVMASVLFGMLYQGGSELSFTYAQLDRNVVTVLQGLIVLFSGALAHMLDRPLSRLLVRRARPGAG